MTASNIKVSQRAAVQVGRSGKPRGSAFDQLAPCGEFKVEHWRDGILINTLRFPNGVTIEGKNDMLDVTFDAGTQKTVWYMGLIDNTGYSALSENDTYDDIDQAGNGWDEFKTYTDPGNGDSTASRPSWSPDPASGKSISNSTQTVFDITGTATVKGLFLVAGTNAQTKGDHTAGTAHKLWSTALFDQGDTSVVNGDQLKVTYTINT